MIGKHVISLDIAIHLYRVQIKTASIFYWVPTSTNLLDFGHTVVKPEYYPFKAMGCYSAYTASELLDILPEKIIISPGKYKKRFNDYYYLTLKTCEDKIFWYAKYSNIDPYGFPQTKIYEADKFPQNSLAKLIIFLIEKKLVEIPK